MSQKVTQIRDCPYLIYPLCNAPESQFHGLPYWQCAAVREIRLACALENEKNLTPKGGNTG